MYHFSGLSCILYKLTRYFPEQFFFLSTSLQIISLWLLTLALGVMSGASLYDYFEREFAEDRHRRRSYDKDWEDYRPSSKTKEKAKENCGISPELQAKLQALTDTVKALAKQTMILQESVEERYEQFEMTTLSNRKHYFKQGLFQ